MKIYLNYNNLLYNFKLIQNYINNLKPNTKIIPIIKSNAYRINEENVIYVLIKNAYVDTFFTFSLLDAIRIRKFTNLYFPTKKFTIYSVMGILNGEEKYYYNYQIIPVINNIEQYNIWNNFSKNKKEKLNCVLQFNTGMNRSGFEYFEAKNIKNLFDTSNNHLNIDYIISHLYCASDIQSPMNERQLNNFFEVKKIFNKNKFCFAASEGQFFGENYLFDAIRPFLCLISPINKENIIGIKQVLEIETNILKIKNNTALINIGYQNYYKKELLENNNLSVIINGKKYKVLNIYKTKTKIQIDNTISVNDNVIITDKNYTLPNITENSSLDFVEIHLGILSNKKNSKNIFYKNIESKDKIISKKESNKIDKKRFLKKKKNIFETIITETRIIINNNEYVGYSSKYKAKIGDKICVIPVGYFDIDKYFIKNNKLKFTSSTGIKFIRVGNPSMNQITIKCKHKDNNKVNIGNKVIIEIIK